MEQFPKPLCEGMSRKEITALLNKQLVNQRLTRRNAYSYWAHEVVVSRHLEGKGDMRIDFMQFEPYGYHTCTDVGAIELGTFTCYEVKSCIEDLKSGHGLNFIGDENWIVMPVEAYEDYNKAITSNQELWYATYGAGLLLYGKGRSGHPTFFEIPTSSLHTMRRRSASELLLCMMRALIANSDQSNVDHPIKQTYGNRQ